MPWTPEGPQAPFENQLYKFEQEVSNRHMGQSQEKTVIIQSQSGPIGIFFFLYKNL